MKIDKNRWLKPCAFALAAGLIVVAGCSSNVTVSSDSGGTTSAPGMSTVPSGIQGGNNSGGIAWQPTYETAWQVAYNAKKPLMIDFYTTWCGPCKMLDEETYKDSSIVSESEKFVSVKVDAEQRTDLARYFNINAYPTVLWIDNRGQVIHSMVGFAPPQTFSQEIATAMSKFQPGT